MADLFLTLLAMVACYCFVRAAMCAPGAWRAIRDGDFLGGSRMPTPPPPPYEVWLAEKQQRQRTIDLLARQLAAKPPGGYVTIPDGIDPREVVAAMPLNPKTIRAKFTLPKERRLHDAR